MVAFGRLETDVMEALWHADEPMTVREVLTTLNRGRRRKLAYTTVMTVMVRLAEKGALSRRPRGRGYAYEPTEADQAALAVRGVLAEHGDAALSHFVDQVAADPDALRRLRKLMGDASEVPP